MDHLSRDTMRVLPVLLALVLSSTALAQSEDHSSAHPVLLHVRAYLDVQGHALPTLPPSFTGDEALRSVEMEQASASAYWLDARFLFASVEAYESWSTSDATERTMAVLQQTQPLQTRLVVGEATLLSREHPRD